MAFTLAPYSSAVAGRGDPAVRCERSFQRPGIDVVGCGVYIHEHGPGAGEQDRVGRGDEGEGRGDDLVARPDPMGQQGDVQGGGAGVDRHGVLNADEAGEALLELLHLPALGQDARPQHLGDGGDLVLAYDGPGDGDHAGHNYSRGSPSLLGFLSSLSLLSCAAVSGEQVHWVRWVRWVCWVRRQAGPGTRRS
jgi:hypothetical protein